MTADNIKELQIIATLDNGEHIIAVSDDKILINCVTAWCKFAKFREELFSQCSLKELIV